jgi:hypothetical protein
MTVRTRLKQMERLVQLLPPKPQEPVATFLKRPEVRAAFCHDPEVVAGVRVARRLRRKVDPDILAWIEE